MLRSLSLHNLALFKKQEIEFSENLNVILGETGAGKSLIFDALNFVLSFKTDKTLLRSGEESMRVDAVFQPVSETVKQLLKEAEIDDEGELIVSRTLHSDGRTSSRVNGMAVSQSFVKALASELVDTFLQHENLQILKSKNHISFLDKFCDFGTLKSELSKLIDQQKQAQAKLNSIGGSEQMRLQRKDILEYQIRELTEADLQPDEDVRLDEKIKLLESSERIVENLGQVLQLLEAGANGIVSQINMSAKLVGKLGDIENLPELRERLESAQIELDDVASELREVLSKADSDPRELERLDARRDIASCLETLESLKQQLDELCSSAELSEKLSKQIEELKNQEEKLCESISNIRKSAAVVVKKRLLEELADLGMKSTQFEVTFERKEISADGFDDVVFTFSANKGQELKDLAKTASGGESSRIMLAMKNMFAKEGDYKTLLFDEIDSGISGEIGNMMAQKLASIARRDQVITITHLPQVASAGDNFLKVEKFVENNSTISRVQSITGKDVIKEIAHIIGGDNVTDIMLENAQQLYQRGRKFGRS